VLPQDPSSLLVARTAEDAPDLGDRHVDRSQQRDDASRTGLSGAVVAVTRSRVARRRL
jgi:hypothetical protein